MVSLLRGRRPWTFTWRVEPRRPETDAEPDRGPRTPHPRDRAGPSPEGVRDRRTMVQRGAARDAGGIPRGPRRPAHGRRLRNRQSTQPEMPRTTRPARAIAAACFVVVTMLAAVPASAAALEPPRPLPGYRPAFVTETDEHPWTDCLWASGAMLLDKWTNGRMHRSHQQLRSLRRLKGGSALAKLHAAYAAWASTCGTRPMAGSASPGPPARRLGNGAGAVLLGDDSQLPRWYGRWDPSSGP